MKIKLDINDSVDEIEISLKAKEYSDEVKALHEKLLNYKNDDNSLLLYDDNKEYLIAIKDIIFFETEGDKVYAHTTKYSYFCKSRLYELLDVLPHSFIRISKSTIINIHHLLSIERKFTSSSLIQFNNTHKEVYVSRRYYNNLKEQLLERSKL